MTITENMLDLAETPAQAMPAEALALARLSLLDWMVCGLAGQSEPVAQTLRALAEAEGGQGAATLFGGGKAPARMAALVNGAASHALDFDDTHFAHVGHLSVGIYPAALAVGEQEGAGAAEVIAAFLAGAEGAIRLGQVLGAGHYNRGFHQTATAGAFGAVLAAGRLMGLDRTRMRAALGLCATRVAGLKSQFGTMGKPYNAGIAAATGVEAAMLARLGMTSADDGIAGPQGFIATHADHPDPAAGWPDPPDGTFRFARNSYKLHACCHGLHAMIEALQGAGLAGLGLEAVEAVEIRTNPRWLRVCDIKAPRTGLEVKFSYAWLAGMVIAGRETGDHRAYTDAVAADPALAGFARRVKVEGDAALSDMQVSGTARLAGGRSVALSHDLADPIQPEALEARLHAKSRAALGPEAGDRLARALADPAGLSAADLGAMVAGRGM